MTHEAWLAQLDRNMMTRGMSQEAASSRLRLTCFPRRVRRLIERASFGTLPFTPVGIAGGPLRNPRRQDAFREYPPAR